MTVTSTDRAQQFERLDDETTARWLGFGRPGAGDGAPEAEAQAAGTGRLVATCVLTYNVSAPR